MTGPRLYGENVKAGNTEGVSVWTGVIWLGNMSSAGLLWTRNYVSGSIRVGNFMIILLGTGTK